MGWVEEVIVEPTIRCGVGWGNRIVALARCGEGGPEFKSGHPDHHLFIRRHGGFFLPSVKRRLSVWGLVVGGSARPDFCAALGRYTAEVLGYAPVDRCPRTL